MLINITVRRRKSRLLGEWLVAVVRSSRSPIRITFVRSAVFIPEDREFGFRRFSHGCEERYSHVHFRTKRRFTYLGGDLYRLKHTPPEPHRCQAGYRCNIVIFPANTKV